MKRICTICARGGSKGVPGKNLKEIGGIPLIVHTIRQALDSKLFDDVVVSSDSLDILEVSKKFGATLTIQRPANLALDTSAKVPVIRHCVNEAEKILKKKFILCVDLDCTSPLRIKEDIIESVKVMENGSFSNLITGCKSRRSPYFNLVELSDDNKVSLSKSLSNPVVRRQDAPKSFDMNGSIYIWKREVLEEFDDLFLENTKLYEMPEERSVDIDSPLDFKIVELLLKERLRSISNQ